MASLTWTTVQRQVNTLLHQSINPRKMSDKLMSDLKKSLKRFNLVEIPAIDVDGTILAGHQRIKALQLLGRGEELIDVRVPNRKLTDEESRQYLITSNAVVGDWDFELLKEFDTSMLLDVGLDAIQIPEFWTKTVDALDDDFDIQKELGRIEEPQTKLGDIIQLGNHRVICGDSTREETLSLLLRDEKASMIYSDPVYNIDIDYAGGIGGTQDYRGSVHDNRSFGEYKAFISNSLNAALRVSHPDTHVFYWCDQNYIGLIQEVYRAAGIVPKRVCLWLKNNQNPVPSVAFNKVYEPVVYGIRGTPVLTGTLTAYTEVMNKELRTGNELLEQTTQYTDIWTAKRLPAQEYEHATSKPITLHERAIKRCTQPGDIILDSFLGSGSTLLAGEQLGRRVYGCELEPRFCDLIIKRYKAATGKDVTVIRNEKA